ncbi:MAG TPA: response regulator [Polyangiaceae bacterium]|jgi:two-component system probable response regulator PhcQ|nr:response regulator [Polyangiaceae bacterium]
MTYDVLYVDDEPDNLAVFEAAFADRFSVLLAHSALEALDLMRHHQVLVLLADQRMPYMTGLELLAHTRLEFPDVVRMMVTAYADLDSAIAAINNGHVRRYLKKPWENAEILAAIAEGVEYYQMRAKLCALERRLLETERVYSLGVITSGLARELNKPVSDLRERVTRARGIVRAAADSVPPDSGRGSALRASLLDSDDELGEALAGAERALDVVRGVEIPVGRAERQNVDVSEVLRLTLRLLQGELRAAASVRIDVHPVPPISGSAAQLGQVMLNLLVHALETSSGAPRHQRALTIRLSLEAPWIVFEVESSAPGNASDRPPASGEVPALGQKELGLAISQSIVDELGGKLHTETGPIGGVRRVKLPPAKATAA